jgi:hypothetical protein
MRRSLRGSSSGSRRSRDLQLLCGDVHASPPERRGRMDKRIDPSRAGIEREPQPPQHPRLDPRGRRPTVTRRQMLRHRSQEHVPTLISPSSGARPPTCRTSHRAAPSETPPRTPRSAPTAVTRRHRPAACLVVLGGSSSGVMRRLVAEWRCGWRGGREDHRDLWWCISRSTAPDGHTEPTSDHPSIHDRQ